MTPGPAAPRRGMSVVAIVFLVMLAAAGAIYLYRLGAQAGRTSHWFVHAQEAQNLARAGLVAARGLLRSIDGPAAGPGLEAIRAALAAGTLGSGTYPLVDSGAGAALPPGVEGVLRTLDGLAPGVKVELAVVEARGLEMPAGLAADPGEREGRVQLVARGWVVPASGGRVERSLVMELGYKRVSVLVPLFSRFVLFAAEQEGGPVNFVDLAVDETTGDARRAGGPIPLVVRAGAAAELGAPGRGTLDRSRVTAAFTAPDFLDRQGWIHLGGSTPWVLNLAHGFDEEGETAQLPGDKRPVAFPGAGGDAGFRSRFSQAAPRVAAACTFGFDDPGDGLYHAFHAYARGYQKLAVDRSLVPQLGPGATKPDLGEAKASGLRLFGTPGAVSPTLVFGPVDRAYLRRASVRATMGPPGRCPRSGSVPLALLKLGEHSPEVAAVLEEAFGGAVGYEEAGTAPVIEPYLQALNVVLDARGGGAYAPNGLLAPGPGPGPGPAAGGPSAGGGFRSVRVSGLEGLPQVGGALPAAALQAMRSGELQAPDVFSGRLADGPAAVHAALAARLTYQVPPEAVAGLLVDQGRLRVPGVVLVPGPVTLPAVREVAEGGILVAAGPIEVTGELLRGAGRQPVALVSLKGDVVLGQGATRVEAVLVALDGRVKLPPGESAIEGTLAGRWLDLDTLRSSPASRRVSYALDMDRSHAPAREASYRIHFGGQAAAAVAGAP